MRKITQLAKEAFQNFQPFNQSNTQVSITPNGDANLVLHSHLIASKRLKDGAVAFTLAGWPTATTKERLKAAGVSIVQKEGKPYYKEAVNNALIEIDAYGIYQLDGNALIHVRDMSEYNVII